MTQNPEPENPETSTPGPARSGPDRPRPEGFDAVVLAGGAATRMGGADKPGLTVAGRTLLERVVDAVRAHTPDAGVTVVGPERDRPRVRYVREEPPGGGPVPALRAGLPHVRAPWLALLAADLPHLAPSHLAALATAAPESDGAVFVDATGREQWLTGVWRTDALRTALTGYRGRSLYRLLEPLAPVHVPLAFGADGAGNPGAEDFDVDTPEALERVRRRLG